MLQEWFKKARLGIFIHYGIYAVRGTSESWAFKTGECTYKKYMTQLKGFTAANYDANVWADLIKRSGATYAVLTAKHHDGVALYDSAYSDLSTVKATPSKKDIMTPYCDALRARDIKVGIYFTQLDWSHPDYTSKHWRPLAMVLDKSFNKSKRWDNFLNFHHNQLTEVLTKFAPVDLLWFDGDWERSQADWKMKEMKEYLDKFSPTTVVNSRIGSFGDYATPEQQMPVVPPDGAWEYCMTCNDSWGYRPKDNNYKSLFEIIRTFCEIITMGGTLLLDIGPMEDGTIDMRAVKLLEGLGDFTATNAEAIYTTDNIKNIYSEGGVMLSADKLNMYLFNYDSLSTSMPFLVTNLKGNIIANASLLGGGADFAFSQSAEGAWLTPSDDIIGINIVKITFTKPFEEVTTRD